MIIGKSSCVVKLLYRPAAKTGTDPPV